MQSLTANEAKIHFGDLLIKAQREPIQINRNGKAIAIVLSIDDYRCLEALKIQQLKTRVKQAKSDIAAGLTVDGNECFDQIFDGKFD